MSYDSEIALGAAESAAASAVTAANAAEEAVTLSGISTADGVVTALIEDSGSDTSAAAADLIEALADGKNHDPRAIDPNLPLNGTGDQIATMDAAIATGHVVLPAGSIRVVGDLVIDVDSTTFRGLGHASHINVHNGAVVLKGPSNSVNLLSPSVGNFSVTRTGTAGPAVKISGAATGSGTARFDVTNVTVRENAGGAGLHIEGSYIGDLFSFKAYNAAIGIKMTTLNSIGVNAVNFHGGEVQGCDKAGEFDTLAGVNFFGTCFEGSISEGVELLTLCRAVGFWGCYFEANAGYDIQVGDALNPGPGLVIKGGFFMDGTGKTNSIRLVRGMSVAIEDIDFAGYGAGDRPILVDEGTPGDVVGYTKNCTAIGADAVVDLGGSTTFRDENVHDTGSRRMSASLLNSWAVGGSGSFVLRRIGDVVEWSAKELNGTGKSANTFLDIPDGFRPTGPILVVQPIRDGGGSAWQELVINGAGTNTLECNSASAFLYGRATWLTADPWPATLPGTAF